MSKNLPAILILEDGATFLGKAFGAIGKTFGEVCFNTGMTGYQEILTDPSYARQIVTMTAPHIGNYGINDEDVESNKIQASGFVIKEESILPSNWRSQTSIGEYLEGENIVGIKDIDTRSLTIHLRNHGAMNGVVCSEDFNESVLKEELNSYPSMEGMDLAKIVSTKNEYIFSKKGAKKVVVLDLGVKKNILNIFQKLSY